MTDSTAVGDLRAAFTTLGSKGLYLSASDLAGLQARVFAAVDEMKAAGILPERIMVAVKGLASDTGMQWNNAALFEQLVGWCVDRYYGPPGS